MSGRLPPSPPHAQCKWMDHAPKAYAHAQSYTHVVNCRAAAEYDDRDRWGRQAGAVQADCQACWSSCRRRCVYIENYPTYRVDVVADNDGLARGVVCGRAEGDGGAGSANTAAGRADALKMNVLSIEWGFTVASVLLYQIEKFISLREFNLNSLHTKYNNLNKKLVQKSSRWLQNKKNKCCLYLIRFPIEFYNLISVRETTKDCIWKMFKQRSFNLHVIYNNLFYQVIIQTNI